MNKIYTMFIRVFGNIFYLLINSFYKKEYVVIDTCFNNIEDSDTGVVYNYFKCNCKVIVVKNNKNQLKKNEILKKSFLYYLYLAKAKLIVTNNAHHLYLNKNKNTIIINTWHGTPYKNVSIGKFSSMILKFSNRNTTYHISGNKFFEEKYLKEIIGFNGNILRDGFFRNDILFSKNFFYQDCEFCKNEKKNILICPTWRDYGDDELIKQTSNLIKMLNKILLDNYNVLLKMHNKSVSELKFSGLEFYNVSDDKFESQKLLTITDILITDYSSIFFDFALLKKPIILFQFDEKEYKEKRGLLIDNIEKEYGITVCKNIEDILIFLQKISFCKEQKKIERFNYLIGQYETTTSFNNLLYKINIGD